MCFLGEIIQRARAAAPQAQVEAFDKSIAPLVNAEQAIFSNLSGSGRAMGLASKMTFGSLLMGRSGLRDVFNTQQVK